MENTKENKEKYFAQYWGQEVAVQGEGGGLSTDTLKSYGWVKENEKL